MSGDDRMIGDDNVTQIDQRIAYGVRCTWWDSINKVGTVPGAGLPCCPFCKGVLYEVGSLTEWMKGAGEHDKYDPGYKDFILWARGKCFPNYEAARLAYKFVQECKG